MPRRYLCPKCRKLGIKVDLKLLQYTCMYCSFRASLPADLQLVALARAAMPNSSKRNLRITDPAWNYLVEMGKQYNYIRAEGNANHIGVFITTLAKLSFKDSRPSHIASTQQWHPGIDFPRTRRITLSDDTLSKLRSIAQEYQIHQFRHQRAVLDGMRANVKLPSAPSLASDLAYAAPVLEAIGTGWLVPLNVPNPPTNLWTYPVTPQTAKPAPFGY